MMMLDNERSQAKRTYIQNTWNERNERERDKDKERARAKYAEQNEKMNKYSIDENIITK